MAASITVSENITLVTLHNIPAEITFITDVFSKIAAMDVDVDMISLAPVQSSKTSLSFTIVDDDLVKILSYTSGLGDSDIRPIVSSGNCKISIDDAGMEHCPGVAAGIFSKVAAAEADIRLITTSEAQVSILVAKSDLDRVYSMLDGQ